MKRLAVLLGVVALAGCGNPETYSPVEAPVDPSEDTIRQPTQTLADDFTPPNFLVAFTADTDRGSTARSVFELVKNEGAEAVLVAGDLAYDENDPQEWFALVDDVLGADFPVFACVGNHDAGDWNEYTTWLEQRAIDVGAVWSGDMGVESELVYQDLKIVLLGAGTLGSTSTQEAYLADQLNNSTKVWEIACWHKNMEQMQIGGKTDETGWGVYENARMGGALIMTGHEHSYARTNLLSDMSSQTVIDTESPYTIAEGQTIAVVTGLGGRSIRDQSRCLPSPYPYGCGNTGGSIYASDQGADYGALFIEFHVDGDPYKAHAYFKDINGNVIDMYDLVKQVAVGTGVPERS